MSGERARESSFKNKRQILKSVNRELFQESASEYDRRNAGNLASLLRKCRVRLSVIFSRSSGTRGTEKFLWTWKGGFGSARITQTLIEEEKPETLTCALRECKEVSFFVGELFSAMKSFSENVHPLHPNSGDGRFLYEHPRYRGSKRHRVDLSVDNHTMRRLGRRRLPEGVLNTGWDWTYHVWFTTVPYHVHGGRVTFVVELTEFLGRDTFEIERCYVGDQEGSTPIISRQFFTTNFRYNPELMHDLKHESLLYMGVPPHVNFKEGEEFGVGSTLRDMLKMGREKGLEGEITWAHEPNEYRTVQAHRDFLMERQSNSSKARLCFF